MFRVIPLIGAAALIALSSAAMAQTVIQTEAPSPLHPDPTVPWQQGNTPYAGTAPGLQHTPVPPRAPNESASFNNGTGGGIYYGTSGAPGPAPSTPPGGGN
ncbi:MAG TPA: hypothetical protein VFC38_01785 [Stellaceae bacterium]|nr:hypothetical protein [Stellaceae bacterium]